MTFGSGLPALGVKRPVLVTVVNLLVVLAGVAAVLGVDVRELPNVDRPVVAIRAALPGASPETMDGEVTRILEGAAARVPGVIRIESASEENSARVKVEFRVGTDLNDAASDVREAISQIQRELPEALEELFVIKADDDAEPVLQLAAYSATLSNQLLAKRIEKDVAPELRSVEGVADLRLEGERTRVLRVLIDPVRLAGYRVSLSEVIETIRGARFDVPAGSYESSEQELIVRAYASVVDPERFERLEVRDGLRIEDLGEVFYAPADVRSYSLLNGRQVVGLGVVREAGANTIAISEDVRRRVAAINDRARDFELVLISDDAVYIRGALEQVLVTLVFSVGVVLVVIALFLGQWRAVIVPAVTMPVSLIGTFAAIWALGFSINLLTLLALVLATGLIVDDAIVVLENIQRRRSAGLGALAAAVVGANQVLFAVIATTLTLIAVFLPIAFLPGDTGRLFREFGLTLAIAVAISSFVALTLCPMLTSRLAPRDPGALARRLRRPLEATARAIQRGYLSSLEGMLARRGIAVVVAMAVVAAGARGFFTLSQELLPREDRGALRILVTGPDGASLAYADRQARAVEQALAPYRDRGLVSDIYTIVGSWDPHRAFTTAPMVPWDARSVSQLEVAAELDAVLSDLPGGQVRIIQGSVLARRGPGGLELAIVGSEYEEIHAAARDFAETLTERVSAIRDVNVKFDTSQPQLFFDIDRERAADLGVPMAAISDVLKVMVDEFEAVDLNIEDQTVPVMVGALGGSIDDPGDLVNLFVTSETGERVPLSTFVEVVERGGAAQLDRHSQSRAIELDVGTPPGTALGEVIAEIRRLAKAELPAGMNVEFLGEAARLREASGEVAVTFAIAFTVVFLVLAAQFESVGSALIVIFTVPLGLSAAVLALLASGQSLNLYTQIGMVMLVGIITKNAILLVEFMDQLRDTGHGVREAVLEGAEVRLRPLVMTVLSTVLGSLPLVLSTGPGAEARNAIGWVVFGGAGVSTVFTLYFAPLGYALIAPWTKPRAHGSERLAEELERYREGGGR